MAHQIRAQSDQRFVCKCADIVRRIKAAPGKYTNSVEGDQNLSGQWRPVMSWPTKFELNLISVLPANVQKLLNQSETRKRREFSKSLQTRGGS